jgi:hypothetical protein
MAERGRGRSPVVGAGSPGSREAAGEGGEGFISHQKGQQGGCGGSRVS